jgi:methionyl-tRNA synthetase
MGQLSLPGTIALILVILWSLPWKGVALWKAARNNQTGWFVALIILNTVGILEITYLYFFQRNKNV